MPRDQSDRRDAPNWEEMEAAWDSKVETLEATWNRFVKLLLVWRKAQMLSQWNPGPPRYSRPRPEDDCPTRTTAHGPQQRKPAIGGEERGSHEEPPFPEIILPPLYVSANVWEQALLRWDETHGKTWSPEEFRAAAAQRLKNWKDTPGRRAARDVLWAAWDALMDQEGDEQREREALYWGNRAPTAERGAPRSYKALPPREIILTTASRPTKHLIDAKALRERSQARIRPRHIRFYHLTGQPPTSVGVSLPTTTVIHEPIYIPRPKTEQSTPPPKMRKRRQSKKHYLATHCIICGLPVPRGRLICHLCRPVYGIGTGWLRTGSYPL